MTAPGRSFTCAAVATTVVLAVFVACVFASTLHKWHPAVTGPCTAFCGVGLLACGIWLNRAAGGSDHGGPE